MSLLIKEGLGAVLQKMRGRLHLDGEDGKGQRNYIAWKGKQGSRIIHLYWESSGVVELKGKLSAASSKLRKLKVSEIIAVSSGLTLLPCRN